MTTSTVSLQYSKFLSFTDTELVREAIREASTPLEFELAVRLDKRIGGQIPGYDGLPYPPQLRLF